MRTDTIGFKRETTEGTAITVDKWFPADSFPISAPDELIKSKGLTGNLGSLIKPKKGKRTIGQKIVTDLFDVGLASYLTPHFGSVVTTGTTPKVHTYAFAQVNYGETLQSGITQLDLDVVPWTIAGAKVGAFSLSATVGGDNVKLDTDWLGRTLVHTSPVLATPSYATASPLSWVDTSVSIGGTAAPNATEYTLNVNRQMEHKWGLGSASPRRVAMGSALAEVSGTIAVPYEDQAWFDAFRANTTQAILLTVTDGTSSFVVTVQSTLSGDPVPKVNDAGENMQQIGFEGFGSNASILTAVLTTTEASAA